MKQDIKYGNIIIPIIYIIFLIFFIFKMIFYSSYVGRFPDETAHISYIAYLEQTNKIIPEFKEMNILYPEITNQSLMDSNKYKGTYIFTNQTNYLGHPPLYYQIMRLSGGVSVHDGQITIDINRLRYFNMLIAIIAMLLIFYIGYTRIKKNPVYHFLYATICVCVPMLSYVCAGVNNDTLSLVGVTLFTLGLIRFIENKRNYNTYILIGCGIFIAFFSKLTAGLIVTIALVLIILLVLIKEKKFKSFFNKNSLILLPFCTIILIYNLFVYIQIGSIIPTLNQLDPIGFQNSGFYIRPISRIHYSFFEYFNYFLNSFMLSWTGIVSHISLIKNGYFFSINKIGLFLLWIIPFLLIFNIKKLTRENFNVLAPLVIFISIIITALIQFFRAYYEFIKISGYGGGTQSRYYDCGICAIALAVVFVFSELNNTKNTRNLNYYSLVNVRHNHISKIKININHATCLVLSIIIIYEDFIYFLMYFHQYLN